MKTNVLTYFLQDYLWPNSYTLYQILITIIYKTSGLIGVSFAYSIWAITTFLLFKKINPRFQRLNLIAFLIPILTGWFVFALGFRAQVFTFSGIILLIYLLKKAKENPKVLILLPLIFILWANLHGGFVLGLAILGFGALQLILEKNFKIMLLVGIAILISSIAALINPYGLKVYEESLHHANYPLWRLIAEWVPPWPQTKVIMAILIIALGLAMVKFRKLNIFWPLSIITFCVMAFEARRSVPLFFLVLVLAIFDLFPEYIKRVEKNEYFQKAVSLGIITGIFWILLSQTSNTLELSTNWQSFCQSGVQRYPCRAIEYIKTNNIEGKNVYAPYEWGGFLEWQLPQYKFFVDGRTPAWPTKEGKSPYTIYLEIMQAQPGYNERLLAYDTDWLLIGPGTFLDLALANDKNSIWKGIYRDQFAVIYTKK